MRTPYQHNQLFHEVTYSTPCSNSEHRDDDRIARLDRTMAVCCFSKRWRSKKEIATSRLDHVFECFSGVFSPYDRLGLFREAVALNTFYPHTVPKENRG